MIKAVIIDDEQHCIDALAAQLEEYKDSIYLMNYFKSVEDGMKGIKMLKPDVVFLDIQIDDKTGFDLLESFKDPDFNVIFTTGHDNFAIKAFRFSAIDYLLKPVDSDDLSKAIEKLQIKISKDQIKQQFDILLTTVHSTANPLKIALTTNSGYIFTDIKDIIRCESSNNYTIVHLSDKKTYPVTTTLKEFEELLSNHNFFRIHHSHLINLSFVKNYNKAEGYVTMTNGEKLDVSVRKREEFLKKFSTF